LAEDFAVEAGDGFIA